MTVSCDSGCAKPNHDTKHRPTLMTQNHHPAYDDGLVVLLKINITADNTVP